MQPSTRVPPIRPPTIRAGIRIAGIVALLVLVLLCWLGWRELQPRVNLTVEEVEQMVQTQIPRDATRQQIEGWYAARGLNAQYFDGNDTDSERGKSVLEIAGVAKEDVAGFARGEFREAEVELLRVRSIFVYFFFDCAGKVIGHLVRPFDYML